MARIADAALAVLLAEDAPHGDLTSDTLPLGAARGRVQLRARQPMVASGIEEAARLFEMAGATAQPACASGAAVEAGALLLQAEGAARPLLLAWKTAQTLAEAMGGMATATRAIVDALAAAGCPRPLACTRKNFPGTRAFAARAVKDGGGVMHRLGLSETLLVFPEHLIFIEPGAQPGALRALRAAQPEKRLVVEVGDTEAALAAARAGADVLQLERFTPSALASLAAALAAEGLAPLLAPAGGVNVGNAVAYARAGAAFLVSSAPYFAPPTDVQVRFSAAA